MRKSKAIQSWAGIIELQDDYYMPASKGCEITHQRRQVTKGYVCLQTLLIPKGLPVISFMLFAK